MASLNVTIRMDENIKKQADEVLRKIDNKYKIFLTGKFKKDLKLAKKKGYNLSLLSVVVNTLAEGKPLPEKYKDHNLSEINM